MKVWGVLALCALSGCCCGDLGLEEREAPLEPEREAAPAGERAEGPARSPEEAAEAPEEVREPEEVSAPVIREVAPPPEGRMWLSAAQRDAPQIPGLDEVFKDIGRSVVQGELEGALVVCRVHTTGNFDTFRGPDLTSRFRFGERRVSVVGPEDVWTMHASIPKVSLSKGAAASVQVVDRDVFEVEEIGDARVKFEGAMPLFFESKAMEVECRALGGEAVEARAASQIKEVEGLIKRAGREIRPDPRQYDWGREGSGSLREAKVGVAHAAGWVGWEDARVERLARQVDGVLAAWDEASRSSVSKALEALPPFGEAAGVPGSALEVRVARVECGDKALRALRRQATVHQSDAAAQASCAVYLEVKNEGKEAQEINMFQRKLGDLEAPALVRPDGVMVGLEMVVVGLAEGGWSNEERSLGAGERAEVALVPLSGARLDEEGPERPVMLWVRTLSGGEPSMSRLR